MKKQQNGNAKLVIIIISLAVAISIIGLTIGFFVFAKKYLEEKYTQGLLGEESESTSQTSENLKPGETVMAFLKNTLGTIPGANYNLQSAKQYATSDFKSEIDSPGFVPKTFCIQNGPEKVKVAAENIDGEKASVKISALYGGEWTQGWEFSLVLTKGNWEISKIKCLTNDPGPAGSAGSSDSYAGQRIKDIPIYLGSTVKSFTDEGGQQGASYTTPAGVSGKQVLEFYDLNMPTYGWAKTASDGSRSRTYKHRDGRRAEVWIFYSNPNEWTDYVVECPPFTGHPSGDSQ